MSTGYIKLFRCLKQSSFYKDSEYVHLWVHLLMSVNRTEKRLKIGTSNKFIDLLPGQVLTSRDKLSEQTGIHRSKIDRILKAFQSEQQVEQQTFSKYRIISISKWWEYQVGEQQSEPQVSHKRAASEPQVSTNKKEKKEKKTPSALERRRSEGFEELYNDYPRKEGRKEALRHYNASVKTLEDMVKIDLALSAYREQVRGKDRQYIQQASRWFNNWQDYVPDDWEPAYLEAKAAWEAENEDNEREEDGPGADD